MARSASLDKKKGEKTVKFIAQSFALLCIVFVGVLSGIQVAHNGMEHKVYQQTGMGDTGTDKNDEAVVEALGKNIDTGEKEKQLQRMKSSNTLSKVGEGFATTVEKTVEIAVEPLIIKVKNIISQQLTT